MASHPVRVLFAAKARLRVFKMSTAKITLFKQRKADYGVSEICRVSRQHDRASEHAPMREAKYIINFDAANVHINKRRYIQIHRPCNNKVVHAAPDDLGV